MPLHSLREIVEYATRKKECRNATLAFVCTRQTRVNCQGAKGKGVLKFRKLKKILFGFFGNLFGESIDYKSGWVCNLNVVEPLQLVQFNGVGKLQFFYGRGEQKIFFNSLRKLDFAVS